MDITPFGLAGIYIIKEQEEKIILSGLDFM